MALYNKMLKLERHEGSTANANKNPNSDRCLLQGESFSFKSLWITSPQLRAFDS